MHRQVRSDPLLNFLLLFAVLPVVTVCGEFVLIHFSNAHFHLPYHAVYQKLLKLVAVIHTMEMGTLQNLQLGVKNV